MRTERDRAMSLADVFVGPRCKGVGRSGPSIVFASKPTPGVLVPSLRFSFRNHLSFVGWRKYRRRCDCQFARHISLHTSPFQLVFEPSKCPSASTETGVRSKKTSVRSKKKKKTEEFEEECSKEDGEKAPAAKRRKVPKSQSNVLLLHEDKLPLWLSYIVKPIKQQLLQKQTRGAFLCICRFSD